MTAMMERTLKVSHGRLQDLDVVCSPSSTLAARTSSKAELAASSPSEADMIGDRFHRNTKKPGTTRLQTRKPHLHA